MVNDTGLLFDVEGDVLARPARAVPVPVVAASAEDLTPVAGVALWGPVLDRLNVVAEADRRGLRPIGPGGYSGGECYRALTETLLAGGDFLSDRVLLADPATAELRGSPRLDRSGHRSFHPRVAGVPAERLKAVATASSSTDDSRTIRPSTTMTTRTPVSTRSRVRLTQRAPARPLIHIKSTPSHPSHQPNGRSRSTR